MTLKALLRPVAFAAMVLATIGTIAIAANNTQITPGSGTTIATDQVGSVHYQKMKLVDGTEDGTTGAIVTGAGALKVDGSAVTQPVDSEMPAAAALSDAASNPTTSLMGALNLIYNGATWDRARGDITNGIDVDVTRVIPGTAAANLGKAEDGVAADGDAGVAMLGVRRDTPATNAGAAGDYAEIGLSGVGSQWVTPTPSDRGGLSIGPASGAKLISAATTNATSVKASAGQVCGWSISNVNAAARFVKLYNKASAPTVGTDVPVMTILVPGATTGGQAVYQNDFCIAFATGIALATTTGVADADTGAVAASEIVVNLFYK